MQYILISGTRAMYKKKEKNYATTILRARSKSRQTEPCLCEPCSH